MKPIKKLHGTISAVTDLSPSARAITISLTEPMEFVAGCFVNLFIERDGVTLRRAFSISSNDNNPLQITVSVRLSPKGQVTPLFWNDDIVGTPVELMGPLGLNTADKMHSSRLFLFGFGVGAGVVKALAEHFSVQPNIESITIMTGNRSVEEILHKDFLDALAEKHSNITVDYVLPHEDQTPDYKKGFIQDHFETLNFNHSDVYVCGQEVACTGLVEAVKKHEPVECNFFVEAFH
ncbi:MAG: hypothetical protein RLZZ230_291 [Candidatus Parcubacteria bacterium]